MIETAKSETTLKQPSASCDTSPPFAPLIFALLLLAFAIHVYWLRCVAEDSYITYRFARNVAEGHGFVWNVGEAPVEGFTNFLWVVLCAGAYNLGLDLPRFTQWIGLFSGLLTLIYAYRFARGILRLTEGLALFTVALLAVAGPLACWAGSGMETVFFAMWIMIAVFHASRFASSRARRDVLISAASLFVATLTRPEGFGVFGIVAGTGLITWLVTDRSTARRGLWLLVGMYLPLFAAYFAWRFYTFGYLLPNTFYAKTGGGFYQYRRGLLYVGFFALHFLGPCVIWLVLAAWRYAGSNPRWSGRGFRERFLDSWRMHPGAWMSGAVVVSYVAYIILVGGDYMAMYRFFVPVLPLIYALVGVAIRQSLGDEPITTPRRLLIGALATMSLGGIFLQSTRYEEKIFARPDLTHGTYRGVQYERWAVNGFHLFARFFDTHKTSENDSLLTWDIGVTGYMLRMKIYDAHGVVDPRIAHGGSGGDLLGTGTAGHEKEDLAYSFSRKPTFVMYAVRLRREPAPFLEVPREIDAQVKAEYKLESVWIENPTNGDKGYFTYLKRRSQPESGPVSNY